MALFCATALNFGVPPSWPKMALNPKKRHKIDLKLIFNHDGGAQKFRAVAQNKAIQIRLRLSNKFLRKPKKCFEF